MIKWDCGAGPEVSTQHRKPADSTSTWSFYRQYAEVALVLEGGKTRKGQGLIFLNLSNFHPNASNRLLIWNLNIISLIIASCASPPWRWQWRCGDRSRCAWCQIQQEDESLAEKQKLSTVRGANATWGEATIQSQFWVSDQSSFPVFGLWEEEPAALGQDQHRGESTLRT